MPADKKPSPAWDNQRRQLRFGSRVVKRFQRLAPNLELILAAFQELGWPERIDNPLGGSYKQGHERLRDAIKKLNRGQDILRFHADGTGQGIRWEVGGDTDVTTIAPTSHPGWGVDKGLKGGRMIPTGRCCRSVTMSMLRLNFSTCRLP
ncbi:MAG: hypothetical protein L0Z62_34685 [Gemmataceae bacterium]|nr:hypothetical protein [Gemmataceae bacterium]